MREENIITLDNFFDLLQSTPLFNYYVLPVTGMNFKSLGCVFTEEGYVPNIRRVLLSKQSDNYFFIEIHDLTYSPYPLYRKTEENKYLLKMPVPQRFVDDIALLKVGSYTKLSEDLKIAIYDFSGVYDPTEMGLHFLLCAISEEISHREILASLVSTRLGMEVSPSSELLPAPKEEWFLDE